MERLKVNIAIEENEEILKEMKQAYLSCAAAVKFCNEQGIPEETIDDNITKIYDFVTDINYCRKCPGLKNCNKPNAMLIHRISYEYGYLETQLTPCKELMKRVTFEKQFKVKDFDDSLLDLSLKEVDHTAQKKIALQKYSDFIKLGLNNSIYMCGAPNSGRSYLTAAICVDAAKRDKGPICFLNAPKRIQELNDLSKSKNAEFQALLDKYSNVPILVLDDFGNEYKNDFVRDAIVYPILSNRLNKKLFTIITSDFNYQDIAELYSTNKAGSIRANQLQRTIKAMCGDEINLGEIAVY